MSGALFTWERPRLASPKRKGKWKKKKMLYTECFVHSIIGLVFKQQPLSQHASAFLVDIGVGKMNR